MCLTLRDANKVAAAMKRVLDRSGIMSIPRVLTANNRGLTFEGSSKATKRP